MKQILKNIGAAKVIPLTTHLCILYTCIMQKVSSQVIVKHWTFVIQKSRRDAFFKSLIGVGTKKRLHHLSWLATIITVHLNIKDSPI